MSVTVTTVCFQGLQTVAVHAQTQLIPGLPSFVLVGLPDKAVAESRERVRAALYALGIALPPKRIVVNLAPADLQKEGSHYDLPIALALLAALGVLPLDILHGYLALGELSLDGSLLPVTGALSAALFAAEFKKGLICPAASGGEAAWGGDISILAAAHLLELINHFKGTSVLLSPAPQLAQEPQTQVDLLDIKGQESAKRALEIAAAGGHNMLMMGPPGAGKSMLATRLPTLLPPLEPAEALEVTMIHSLAGTLKQGRLLKTRPFRNPHHSASMPALVGGGIQARPGEISLAHQGVLFLDELPEFGSQALEALRQPLESGQAVIARANAHLSYPAHFQLIAAMNPCKCGFFDDRERGCRRHPTCAEEYQRRLSGPFLERIDLHIAVEPVPPQELGHHPHGSSSARLREKICQARDFQKQRFLQHGIHSCKTNHQIEGPLLQKICLLNSPAESLLNHAASRWKLSARTYNRILRVSRTIADLDHHQTIQKDHIAEALSYRKREFRSL